MKNKGLSIKVVVILMAAVLLIGGAIGGTMAWLIAQPKTVVNSFTTSDIVIDLFETDKDGHKTNRQDIYQLVPGVPYKKDPKVTVDGTKTNVDIYLFVKVDETNPICNDNEKALLYELNFDNDNWDLVPDQSDVYYKRITRNTDYSHDLLKGSSVTVNPNLTLEDMPKDSTEFLTFTAYAIQVAGFENDVPGAWALAYADSNTP